MPYKDHTKRLKYMREYMRMRRAIERQIIQDFRFKFPDLDRQIRRQFGVKPSKFGFRRKREKK